MISKHWRNMHKYYSGSANPQHIFEKGKIVTYTILRNIAKDSTREESEFIVAEAPIVLAIVEFSDKRRVLSQIVDVTSEELQRIKIGQSVSQVFRKMRVQGKEGVIEYGFKFRLETE